MSFLATDGGPHPPDKLAAMAAEQIGSLIHINDQSSSDAAVAARKQKPRLILDIAEALEEFHESVMLHERKQLGIEGTARLSKPIDPRAHPAIFNALTAATAAVTVVAQGTVFEDHFKKPETINAVRGIIGTWFATSMDIERSHVADGKMVGPDHRAQRDPGHNRNCPHVRAWQARRGL